MATWVIKISKLCNLRCAYCYEWNELGDERRMSLALWERVLVAARSYRERAIRATGDDSTPIVLHGGEPLAAPLSYLRELMAVYRRVIGDTPGFRVSLQTNLYRLTDEHLAFFKEYEVAPGVSFDMVGGVRRSLSGKETESAVARNMDRLRDSGIAFGAITVLARHTAPRLREVYDFFAARGTILRVLPLSQGPETRPEALFAIPNDEILRALEDLFVYWLESGRAVNVSPFNEYIAAAVHKILGVKGLRWDRRTHGEGVVIVNTDGRVYRMDDLYEEEARIGDLSSQTVDEILASERYARTLDFDDATASRVCGGCAFEGACAGTPVLTSKHGGLYEGRCAIDYPMYAFVERYIRALGLSREELRELLATEERDAA